jgi:hypothetical protein
MTWTDEEVDHLIELALPLSEQQGVKQKNFKHWLKGYSMGIGFITHLFTYDEVVKKWKEINEI